MLLQPARSVSESFASTKTRRPLTSTPRFPALTLDQRGAIMVIGVFMSAMLVGILYYVWGLGGALLFRERMQDAADASAFSAAVVHARGMNILVLLNLIMCALAAIEAGLHTARDGLTYAFYEVTATCVAGIVSWCSCSWCCEQCQYVPGYRSSSSFAEDVHNLAKRAIDPMMTFMHGVAVAVRHGAPAAAQLLVIDYSRRDPYHPTTQMGLMFPLLPELQAEDDPTNQPCDDRVYWPAMAVAGASSAAFHAMRGNGGWLWYAAGMGTAWLLDHRSNSREYCPDYFQRVPPDSHLGEEPFQIRTAMYGESPFGWTRGGVAIAAWNTDETGGGLYEGLDYATRIGFAQAEYYYDNPNDDPHEDYLWHQRWRARLRRFRVGGSGTGDCTIPGCSVLGELQNAVVH
ncbi:hypothetical protein DB32_006597 [Sandaracinus amylolyticus]|uniref:Uncharacterized protein n=1 Tax=Sandaracinus amylolyticus TaxID=927083 RepID=A0A0F6W7K2_9BACT|nr:hypothetical protein DB32_006597 [Sandaracinus amylolyticus]